MLNWFNALVTMAVIIILTACAADDAMGIREFDPLELAFAIFLLLTLPVLYKLASRRPKERPEPPVVPTPKRKR
jgi:hypothetical protein